MKNGEVGRVILLVGNIATLTHARGIISFKREEKGRLRVEEFLVNHNLEQMTCTTLFDILVPDLC